MNDKLASLYVVALLDEAEMNGENPDLNGIKKSVVNKAIGIRKKIKNKELLNIIICMIMSIILIYIFSKFSIFVRR